MPQPARDWIAMVPEDKGGKRGEDRNNIALTVLNERCGFYCLQGRSAFAPDPNQGIIEFADSRLLGNAAASIAKDAS